MQIRIYPDSINTKWDRIEVSPVKGYGNEVEVCKPDESDYYSVYLHQTIGEAQCVADMPNREIAFQLAKLIKLVAESCSTEFTISIGREVEILDFTS